MFPPNNQFPNSGWRKGHLPNAAQPELERDDIGSIESASVPARLSRKTYDRAIMSVDEVRSSFNGQWVLLRVTAYSEIHEPLRGAVITHSDDDSEVWQSLSHLLAASPESDASYYVFQACPLVRAWADIREALEETGQEGIMRGRWER